MTRADKGLPRFSDVTFASVLLLSLAPVLAVAAAAVALTSAGPVLFRHDRVGKGGRRFKLLKFRTMYVGRTGPDVTSKADRRITPLGRILRQTKIDELPGLWNVVRGDMSLVGPRPESPAYVDMSDVRWQEVLCVRPGLTDRTTLRLRNEEELLASAGSDPEDFYRTHLVPYKLRGYRDYLAVRTWRSDVAVLARTAIAVLLPDTVPPPALAEIVAGGGAPIVTGGRRAGGDGVPAQDKVRTSRHS